MTKKSCTKTSIQLKINKLYLSFNLCLNLFNSLKVTNQTNKRLPLRFKQFKAACFFLQNIYFKPFVGNKHKKPQKY